MVISKENSIPHNVVTLGLFFPKKKPFYLSQWLFWVSKMQKFAKNRNADSNSPSNHLKNVIQNSNDMTFVFVDHGA
jgi:hypothetical protein